MKVYICLDERFPEFILEFTSENGFHEAEVEITPEFYAEYCEARRIFNQNQMVLRELMVANRTTPSTREIEELESLVEK